jgi:hypothetical protein
MASRAAIRASDADRERAAEHLRQAAAEGRLHTEELEQRLESAFSARTYGQLNSLVADLPGRRLAAPAESRRRHTLGSALALAIAIPVMLAIAAAVVFAVTGVLLLWMLWLAVGWWFFGHHRRRLYRAGSARALHPCGGWQRGRGRARGFWA